MLAWRDHSIWVALFSVLAWQTGALYFIIQTIAHSSFANPIVAYLPLAAAAVVAMRSCHSVGPAQAFGVFTIFWLYLLLSALWSSSHIYLPQKFLRTAVGLPLFFMAGYLTARDGALRPLAVFASLFALGVCAIILIYHVSLLDLLVTSSDKPLDYQRLSVVVGTGAALAFVAGRSVWARIAGTLTFLVLTSVAVVSGGRTGLLLAMTGPAVRFRRQIMRPVVLAMPLIAGIFVITGAAEQTANDLAHNPDVPQTIQRAIIATIASSGNYYRNYYTRGDFARKAWEAFLESPVFGKGLAGFPISAGLGDDSGRYPHNIVLELLAEGGFVGLLIGAMLAFLCLRRLVRQRLYDYDLIWTVFFIGAVIAVVSDDLPAQALLFMSFGMMLGAGIVGSQGGNAPLHLPEAAATL